MTDKEKQLLLKDLCARLPYGVKIHHGLPTLLISIKSDRDGMKIITEGSYGEHIFDIEDMKPYLRPMSSMTKEEKKDYDKLFTIHSDGDFYCENWEWSDFMNSHHFDYRGLIEKGIAIAVTEENNPYK